MKAVLADTRMRRVAALAAVNVLLAAGGWLALVSPQRHHAAAAEQQVQSVQTQLQQIAAATTPVAPKQPKIRTARLYELAAAMPVTEDEPDLLLAVDQLAQASGVQVTALSPSAPTAEQGYTVLPLQMTLSGTYASITSFLEQIRRLVSVRHETLHASGRLFSVLSVSIVPGATGHLLTATASIDAYVFGTLPGVTPLPSSTTTTGTSTTGTSTTSTTPTTTTSG